MCVYVYVCIFLFACVYKYVYIHTHMYKDIRKHRQREKEGGLNEYQHRFEACFTYVTMQLQSEHGIIPLGSEAPTVIGLSIGLSPWKISSGTQKSAKSETVCFTYEL